MLNAFRARWIFVLVSTCLLLPGTLGAASTGSPDEGQRILRMGVHVSEMGSLDPHLAVGSQDRTLADMVFNGLLRYLPGQAPRIEPDLAESMPQFEMVDGRQVWTVNLKRGIRFHAGPATPAYELTSEDVVFSLTKSANRDASAYAGAYDGMSFVSVDRYTLEIIVDHPMSAILFLPKFTDYAGGFIVSRRAVQTMGDDGFKRHPVGTGPFVFDRYIPGEKIVLTANDDYFRGRPKLDGVEMHLLHRIEAREAGLRSGALDLIMGSGEKGWAARMETARDVVIDTHGVGEVITLHLNTRVPPLNDLRVRRAIAIALNRDGFLDTADRRFVGSVFSPVPARFLPGGLAYDEAVDLGLNYPQDLTRARRLMAEAGRADGFALDLVSSEKRLYRTCYATLRRQLRPLGIDCRIQVVSHSDMHKKIRMQPIPMVLYVAWRPNADAFLSHFFHSGAIPGAGKGPTTNFSRYGGVDQIIEAARRETDPNKQVQLWVHAQIQILDDMAALPIMFIKQCYARRAHVAYGHPLVSTMALYPQVTEKTRITAASGVHVLH